MDFELSEEQESLRQLAATILDDFCDPVHLREQERAGEPLDRRLWSQLAAANLVGISLPEAVGGLGLGFVESCVVLEEVGRHVAPVPALATMVLGALPVARWGDAQRHHELLAGVVDGSVLLTAALEEAGARDPLRPHTTAVRTPGGWRLDGVKDAVPYGPLCDRVVVTARVEGGAGVGANGGAGVGVFLVDPAGPGSEMAPAVSTTGHPLGQLRLDGAVVADGDVLGIPGPGSTGSGSASIGSGDEVAAWLYRHAVAGMCAVGIGVLEGGLRVTSDYIAQRQQFGRPIATFQGVAMRIADAYIDTQAASLTAWSAIWRLAEGRPADEALAIAKFWIADGGQRAVHAFQHLHGGIGVDEDYAIHRYFTWAKALEVGLGGATPQLLRLGALLAEDPPAGPEAGGSRAGPEAETGTTSPEAETDPASAAGTAAEATRVH